MLPDMLCHFVRDAYVLGRYGEESDGRLFESALTEIAHLLGFQSYQGAGSLSLFGTRAVSKSRHELDLGMVAPGMLGIVEAKSRANGIGKNDVMLFIQKTFDYYVAKLYEGRRGPTWRFLVSATPVGHPLSVYCMQQGVIVVDPTFLPLPTLLRFVGRPEAEEVFDDVQLAEAVRLFEPACLPLERIFVPQGNDLHLGMGRFFGREADDAQWLAAQMTSDLLTSIHQTGRDPFGERARTLGRAGTRALCQSLRTGVAV